MAHETAQASAKRDRHAWWAVVAVDFRGGLLFAVVMGWLIAGIAKTLGKAVGVLETVAQGDFTKRSTSIPKTKSAHGPGLNQAVRVGPSRHARNAGCGR